MRETIPTSRRSIIKTIGGGAALATVGGGALLAATGGATATGTFDYGDVTITSDDGTVQYVAVYGDSIVEWDGFEREATDFSLAIDAELGGDNTHGPIRIYETGATSASDLGGTVGKVALDSSWGNYDESLSGPGTHGTIESGIGLDSGGSHDPTIDWHVVGTDPDGYPLPIESIPASALEVGTDGTTNTYVVTLHATYRWYDAAGDEIFSKTFDSKVDVTVNDEPQSSTSTNGSGTDGATGA